MTRLDPIFIDSPESIAAERQKMQDDLARMRVVRSETEGLIKGYEGEVASWLDGLMAELATEKARLMQDGDIADGNIHSVYGMFQQSIERLREAQESIISIDSQMADAVQTLADDEAWKPWAPIPAGWGSIQ